MNRNTAYWPPERQLDYSSQAPTPSTYSKPFPPPSAQPPTQIPSLDPFQSTKDPFTYGSYNRNGSIGPAGRAWPAAQGEFGSFVAQARKKRATASLRKVQKAPTAGQSGEQRCSMHDHELACGYTSALAPCRYLYLSVPVGEPAAAL